MIYHEVTWCDISLVLVIQVMQVIKVMQVRLAHLLPDFGVIFIDFIINKVQILC